MAFLGIYLLGIQVTSENRVSDSKNDVEKQISEKSSEPQTSNVKTKRNWPPKEIR